MTAPVANRARRSGRGREGGRLLVELVVAAGIGAVALAGVVSVLPAAIQSRRMAAEREAARTAAERRLIEIVVLDDVAFRRALVAGPASEVLAFDVAGLAPQPGLAHVGAVTVQPAPGSAGFGSATLFELTADCRWSGVAGPGRLRLHMLYRPAGTAGGGSP